MGLTGLHKLMSIYSSKFVSSYRARWALIKIEKGIPFDDVVKDEIVIVVDLFCRRLVGILGDESSNALRGRHDGLGAIWQENRIDWTKSSVSLA